VASASASRRKNKEEENRDTQMAVRCVARDVEVASQNRSKKRNKKEYSSKQKKKIMEVAHARRVKK
jgi:hypothetical protein